MEQNEPAEQTPRVAEPSEEEPSPGMQIVRKSIAVSSLEEMAEGMFGNLVKAVVDVDRGSMAVDAEMHADEEALLLAEGSQQNSLWGINLHPAHFGTPRFIEFDSVINIRPRQGNRTRSVDDASMRAAITAIVERLVKR